MKYTIKDNTFELKYSIRALMMYENITGESFNPKNLTDVLTFLYCIVVSSSKDYSYEFDNFLNDIDENPQILTDLTNWLNSINTNSEILKKN